MAGLSASERLAMHWLWGACGLGSFVGWDRLLTALLCELPLHIGVDNLNAVRNANLIQDLFAITHPSCGLHCLCPTKTVFDLLSKAALIPPSLLNPWKREHLCH